MPPESVRTRIPILDDRGAAKGSPNTCSIRYGPASLIGAAARDGFIARSPENRGAFFRVFAAGHDGLRIFGRGRVGIPGLAHGGVDAGRFMPADADGGGRRSNPDFRPAHRRSGAV